MNHLLNVEMERLYIRPYESDDLEESFKLMQDKELFNFLHFDVMTYEEYQGLFQWLLQSYESKGSYFKYSFAVFLKSTGQMIGWVGVGNLDLLVGLKRLVAKVSPENKASRRIIQKLGFNFEYVLDNLPVEYAECNGELLYSIIIKG
jgi:[ribosomal protein S5]-alanine N-acetyltransferase